MGGDDRAVSVTVGYIINLSIAAILVSGLLIVTSGVVETRSERVIQGELQVIGQQTTAALMSADRLAQIAAADGDGSVNGAVELTVELPPAVAGSGYTVDVNASASVVELTSTRPEVSVIVPYRNDTAVAAATLSGGDVRIVYDAAEERLEVEER